MSSRTLEVKNWKKFQKALKNPDQPNRWVSFATNRDGDLEYTRLTCLQRYALDALVRLRGRDGKDSDYDVPWLCNQLSIDRRERTAFAKAITALIEAGWLMVHGGSGPATDKLPTSYGRATGLNRDASVRKGAVESQQSLCTQQIGSQPAPISKKRKVSKGEATERSLSHSESRHSNADSPEVVLVTRRNNAFDVPTAGKLHVGPDRQNFDALKYSNVIEGARNTYSPEQVRLCVHYWWKGTADAYWRKRIKSERALLRAFETMWQQMQDRAPEYDKPKSQAHRAQEGCGRCAGKGHVLETTPLQDQVEVECPCVRSARPHAVDPSRDL